MSEKHSMFNNEMCLREKISEKGPAERIESSYTFNVNSQRWPL